MELGKGNWEDEDIGASLVCIELADISVGGCWVIPVELAAAKFDEFDVTIGWAWRRGIRSSCCLAAYN